MSGTPARHPALTRSQQQEGAYIRELRKRVMAVNITCGWCGDTFKHTMTTGQKPKYCSPTCRRNARISVFNDYYRQERSNEQ